MVVLIAMLYPFVAEINQFSLFIQIKYYSVIIPTVLFSFTKCKPHFTGEMVEKVFAWPGVGSYALEALTSSDYAPVQGFVLAIAVLYVLLNLTVDLICSLIDPRMERSA